MHSPLVTNPELEHYDRILRGTVYGEFIPAILDTLRYCHYDGLRRRSRELKMRFSDYLVYITCKKVRHNKLNLKLYKNRIVKNYNETDKFLFVWEN